MVNSSVKVFARLKKETDHSKVGAYEVITKKEGFDDIAFLKFRYKGDLPRWYRFHKIFREDSKQSDLFEVVAKPVIDSVVSGFNGTIFAYGQTGSGKTYTITGSPKNYNDRGIIPRSLQYIFEKSNEGDVKPAIYISYMEIYNEIGYDLLSEKQTNVAKSLEELPRITLLENGKGEAHIRNLSVLPVSTENEAMRLLYQGETNRTIAETPMNEYSSRSHCIFTIYITYRDKITQNVRYSKLHLVDLAGSERVCKTMTTGVALGEAKYINLSLHYLQQVIMALTEQKRTHVPYRNSMMTYILRDSLCGNCLTTMLATLAVTQNNIDETISTCSFAQRVSLLVTEPIINEIVDPEQELLFLRNRIEELENRISILTSFKTSNDLPEDIKEKCKYEVETYLKDKKTDELRVDPDLTQIQFCFNLMKNEFVCQRKSYEDHMLECEKRKDVMMKLKQTVTKKEEEINNLKVIIDNIPETPVNLNQSYKPGLRNIQSEPIMKHVTKRRVLDQEIRKKTAPHFEAIDDNPLPILADRNSGASCEDNKILYEKFLKSNNFSTTLNFYKTTLEKKLEMAKLCSIAIEQCQKNILYVKEKIQRSHGPEKKSMIHELGEQQNIYKTLLADLKAIKSDTSDLQVGLEKAEDEIMKKFKVWLKNYSTPIQYKYICSNRTIKKNINNNGNEYCPKEYTRSSRSRSDFRESLSSVDKKYSEAFGSLATIPELSKTMEEHECRITGGNCFSRLDLSDSMSNKNCRRYDVAESEYCIECLEEEATNDINPNRECEECSECNQNMCIEMEKLTTDTDTTSNNICKECISEENSSRVSKGYSCMALSEHLDQTNQNCTKENLESDKSNQNTKSVTFFNEKSQSFSKTSLNSQNKSITSPICSEDFISCQANMDKPNSIKDNNNYGNSNVHSDSKESILTKTNSSAKNLDKNDTKEYCIKVPKEDDDINSQFKGALSVAKVESIEMVDYYDFYKETDSQIFKEFIETVALTGDRELDAQIIEFYRSKFT